MDEMEDGRLKQVLRQIIALLLGIVFLAHMVSPAAAEAYGARALPGNRVDVTLRLSGGNISATGLCKAGINIAVKVSIVLQEKVSGAWITVSRAAGQIEAALTARAKKGNTYRVVATGKFFDQAGMLLETISSTSPSKTY